MNHALPDSLVRYQQALEEAVRHDLAGADVRRRRRRTGIRLVLAGAATVAVGLGAFGLLVRGAPTTAEPAAAAVIRQAAAALAQAPGTILHIKFTAIQDNGDGTTASWSQESFSEETPPYDTRLIEVHSLGTPPGVEQATVNGVSQLYDPTRNTIYVGPQSSPPDANIRHYEFSRGPTPGTYTVHVPVAFRVGPPARDGHPARVTPIYRTMIVTAAQARALRRGTDVVAWERHSYRDPIRDMRVVRASAAPAHGRSASANDASSLDPFSSTFRGQILALLRSGKVDVAGRATVGGRDTIKIESADGHTTYYVAPDSYAPVELTTRGTSGGVSTYFDTYEELPVDGNSQLLSLTAQHPNATIDRHAADFQAADVRLFPHG
jgi:hypothetical protein